MTEYWGQGEEDWGLYLVGRRVVTNKRGRGLNTPLPQSIFKANLTDTSNRTRSLLKSSVLISVRLLRG